MDLDRRTEPALESLETPLPDLERVSGQLRRVTVEPPVSEPAWTVLADLAIIDELATMLGLDRSELAAMARPFRPFMIAAAISIVGSTIAPQAPWVLLIPALFGVVGLLADRHVRFTFADGLIGYRGDNGWPRGVQEEYDITWSRPGTSPTATVRGPATS